MRARIMPDGHAGQGETLEMIRQVNPRVLDRYRTVRIEMTLDDARKLQAAAKFFDDRLSAAEGAFQFISYAAQAYEDPDSNDLRCIAQLCALGLTGKARETDSLMRLYRALSNMTEGETTEPPEPEGTTA